MDFHSFYLFRFINDYAVVTETFSCLVGALIGRAKNDQPLEAKDSRDEVISLREPETFRLA